MTPMTIRWAPHMKIDWHEVLLQHLHRRCLTLQTMATTAQVVAQSDTCAMEWRGRWPLLRCRVDAGQRRVVSLVWQQGPECQEGRSAAMER